jgi:uncharacterized Tic20 family protein
MGCCAQFAQQVAHLSSNALNRWAILCHLPYWLLLLLPLLLLAMHLGTTMHFKEEPDWGFKQQYDGWDQ